MSLLTKDKEHSQLINVPFPALDVIAGYITMKGFPNTHCPTLYPDLCERNAGLLGLVYKTFYGYQIKMIFLGDINVPGIDWSYMELVIMIPREAPDMITKVHNRMRKKCCDSRVGQLGCFYKKR